jgi:hypothetical protein
MLHLIVGIAVFNAIMLCFILGLLSELYEKVKKSNESSIEFLKGLNEIFKKL